MSSSAQKKTRKKNILVGYENKTLDAALRRTAREGGGGGGGGGVMDVYLWSCLRATNLE